MANSSNDNLAVLIDADNAQAAIIHELLAEVSRYGTASVKRAYGDWTTPGLKKWKEVLHEMAIQPIQQFSYTTGKNSTDSALIIDAMDLLHTGRLNGVCLVSSDSDFTRLATRIRESGLVVYGFGERKTPKPFVAACDKFIYSDILKPAKTGEAQTKAQAEPLKPMLIDAVNAAAQDDGWANLGTVGSALQKISPSFDPRNYGFQKLGELVRKQNYLSLKEVQISAAGAVQILVRLK
ncbi:MAG: NYN domain-containing protein [Gammaproteobacteria bacterium]|nr:NYN domain-containing protein [Gammaproteobacteria bacterium]MDH5241293.1 NYN domain-containing protein [Gammaproteobacteria bacterium]MDH5260837.1 NYN domain-containing protein [Gammaproteobacteria bacterium]MDH5582811.1 NYN domain-containing protein [Gammaproteobacteria bacterium]